MATGDIRVVPDPEGKAWEVTREGKDRAGARAGKQADAATAGEHGNRAVLPNAAEAVAWIPRLARIEP